MAIDSSSTASPRGHLSSSSASRRNLVDRVGVLGQAGEPGVDALVQDAAQVAEAEKLLREQLGAVALDELDEPRPIVVGRELFDDAQPQRAAVGQPAVELPLGELLQHVDQQVIGVARARGASAGVPQLGRFDDGADDRLVAVFEQRVELGDGALADRVVAFQLLGEVEQFARFADEAELGQPAQAGRSAAAASCG